MLHVVGLSGYLRVLDTEGPPIGSAAGGLEWVVTGPSDDPPAGASHDDLKRLRRGCRRVALPGADGRALAQAWSSLGHQYPAILDSALSLDARTGYVFGVHTVTSERRRGLGRLAVAAAENDVAARGARAVFAWIERGNLPSRRLFTSLGYRPVVKGLRVTGRGRIRFWCWGVAPAARPYIQSARRWPR
jgi:GNAT superfamily N-acetyltransferase